MNRSQSVTSSHADIINVSGYRFVELQHLPVLQADMHAALANIGVKGTVLLADEGINAALAGTEQQINAVRDWFSRDERFSHLWLKQSPSGELPFSKLKVKIRREIITFQPNDKNPVSPATHPAPTISPQQVRKWLETNESFTLLDTRNTYEVESGTFDTAQHLQLNTFRDFTKAVTDAVEAGDIDPSQPVVTFCTGGIRCEKAAPWMLQNGFSTVYQIEGGILNYFEHCGDAHWRGSCFVFDDRVEITPSLTPTGATLCTQCHRAIPHGHDCTCAEAV